MLTEALLGAVAEAVFGYLLEQAGLAEKLRAVLGRDPQRLAFKIALGRAYTAFARHCPQWAASLFDEHFLTHRAAPFLAGCLTRGASPDPAELAGAWADQMSLPAGERQRRIAELTPACADFVGWLESELRARPEFQPFFDSQALDAIAEATAETAQAVGVLRAELARALGEVAKYQTVVERAQGLVVGDNATVTNVYHTYFSGGFATLADYYVPPDAVFQRVRADEFVGRDWLTAKVDEFLNDPARKSGVFLLVGEAGVGKTAFLAHLVRERHYLHLFAEQVPGEANLPRALQSLGAQLVTRYQIEPYQRRDTLTQLSAFPDFLDRLLRLAAANLTAGEKIVIVCDALDEAGTAGGGNVFGLPAVLPDGVYLILSQRPVPVRLDVKSPLRTERLDATGVDNLRDVREYLEAVARRPAIAAQLRARGYPAAGFVRVLAEKSGGLWMYLQYVIEEIGQGQCAPLDLEGLPVGLAGYYAGYWGDWCEGRNGRGEGPARWDALYAPLLATLAAAQEPVDLERLTAWAGVDAAPYEVERLLGESWRAFITAREEEPGRGLHYRLYHASLRDFIAGNVERAGLTVEGGYLVDELCRRTREAHARIVEGYRQQCSGDWPQIAGQDYARRHLVTHLAGAEQFDELFSLVAESNRWAEARYAAEESYASYLTDLERAWRSVEGEARWDVGRQVRCALIESSIRSLAGNISPDLLRQLVETGLWSPARALAHIPPMPDERRRAQALAEIMPILPAPLKPEALAAARRIMDEGARADALSGLAEHLPEALKAEAVREALAAARGITDEGARARALSGLAGHLPEELKAEALAAARGITEEGTRAEALSGITPHLLEESKAGVVAEALAAARGITDERARAEALSGLAAHLPEALKAEAVREALSAARGITDEWARARALSGVAPHLPEELKAGVVAEALAAARGITDEWARARALSGLASHLPEALKSEALSAAREITNERERAEVLSGLAAHLPEALIPEALSAARGITDEWARAEALRGLAEHLPEALKAEAVREALAVVRGTTDGWARARALSGLAEHLPEALKAEALAVARGITNEWARAEALSGLAAHLPEALEAEAVREALSAARGITDEWERAEVLSGLAEHLPEALKAEGLSAARGITQEWSRAEALSGLAEHLPEALKAEAVREALSAVPGITDEWARAWVLSGLAEHLPEALKAEALSAARGVTDEYWRAEALSGLAAHLPEALRAEALSAARGITDEDARARALSGVAPHLPEELQEEALSAARGGTDEWARARALRGLAEHLPEALKVEALAVARGITDEGARAWALSGLAPHLSEALKAEAVREALSAVPGITDEEVRAWALSGLAAHLPEGLKAEALAVARGITGEDARAEALSGLAAHLPPALKAEALATARGITGEGWRARALSGVAPHLPEELEAGVAAEALAAARGITDEGWRAGALGGVAPHLPEELQGKAIREAFLAMVRGRRRVTDRGRSPYAEIVSVWQTLGLWEIGGEVWPATLHSIACNRRDLLLQDTGALAPLVVHLGGVDAIVKTFRAICDVSRWWP